MKKTKTTQFDPLHIFIVCGKGEERSGVWLQSLRRLAEELLNCKAETILHSSCGQIEHLKPALLEKSPMALFSSLLVLETFGNALSHYYISSSLMWKAVLIVPT